MGSELLQAEPLSIVCVVSKGASEILGNRPKLWTKQKSNNLISLCANQTYLMSQARFWELVFKRNVDNLKCFQNKENALKAYNMIVIGWVFLCETVD